MRIKFNLKKLFGVRGISFVLAISALPAMLTGCGKKADCDVSGKHAHLYRSTSGYVRYIDKEYLSYEGFDRQEEYISIEGQEDLYKFLDKKDLMPIIDNLDLIIETQEKNCDYKEYRYKYRWLQPIPHIIHTGKSTMTYFTYIPHTRYSWTSNPERSGLTGEERICHYVYTAYKIEKDEDGKYVLIPSPDTEDLTTVMDEYPYIKKKFHKVVTLDGKEADYEDGKEEDLTDEEKKRIEEYYNEHPEERPEVKGQSYTLK